MATLPERRELVYVEHCKGINGLDKVVLREVRGCSAEVPLQSEVYGPLRSNVLVTGCLSLEQANLCVISLKCASSLLVFLALLGSLIILLK